MNVFCFFALPESLLGQIRQRFLLSLFAFAASIQPAYSQVSSDGSLGTSINGNSGSGQVCSSGTCQITGGTDSGSNKFHRFTMFDAGTGSGSSITSVTIDSDSQSNIILGIATSSNGFNLNVPLSLNGSKANLFIVSPGGIALSSGSSFSNIIDLTLTNRSTLPVGSSQFSVDSSLSDVQLLTGAPTLNRQISALSNSSSPISINGITLSIDFSLYVHANSDLTVINSTVDGSVAFDVGGKLTISDSTIDNNPSVAFYTLGDLDIYDSTLNANTLLDIDVGGIFTVSDATSSSDSGVSINNNTSVLIDTYSDFDIANASISYNDSIAIAVGGDFYAVNIPSITDSGVSINDNLAMDVSVGGDFVFYSSELLRNSPYTTAQYESDFDVVDALPYFTIEAVGMIDVDDSSVDNNGSFELISSASDVYITNSDFLDNLYPYIESVSGDITIVSSLLARNAFIDAYALGDAYVFDTSVVGNDLIIGAEQGDAAIVDSDVVDNVLVVSSSEGDAVIVDSDVIDNDVVVSSTDGDSVVENSNVENTVIDVESETGDSAISDSNVTDSDVLAFSYAGDVIVLSSNIDQSAFEAAAFAGNVDVMGSEFVNNQELVFNADLDVTISESSVAGNELVVVDVGNNLSIESSNVSDDVVVDAGNEFIVASSKNSEPSSVEISGTNENVSNASSEIQAASPSADQSTSQENATSTTPSVADSGRDDGDDSTAKSDSRPEANSEDEADASSDPSSDRAGSSSANEETESKQTSDTNSLDTSTPSFQSSSLDNTVVAANLQDSINSNANQVSSALGLNELTPTPASELTPTKISQRLNDARQVFTSLTSSLLLMSDTTVASASPNSLISNSEGLVAFNPAYLNISYTKNSDLGVGDPDKGFIDLTLITSEGSVVGRRTELPLSEFSSLLRGFYGKLTSQRSIQPDSTSSESSRLYELFLKPLEEVLIKESISSVLVSADRGLQAIPFTALATEGSFAVNRISFSLTPSLALTDLSVPLNGYSRDQILIMGSSEFTGLAPLPFVNQEVENINKVYDGLVVTNEQFTSQRVVSDLQSSTQAFVHLATHADFKGGRPDESIIHTRDGSISFDAFKAIRRTRQTSPIQLFVLSACRSALGDSASEMGLAGMALQAGAKSAIGSLWYVDDVATSAFFSQFYRYLSSGVPKSVALGMTQRAFAAGNIKVSGSDVIVSSGDVLLSGLSSSQKYNYPNDFRHPFFWSGFVLLGTPW